MVDIIKSLGKRKKNKNTFNKTFIPQTFIVFVFHDGRFRTCISLYTIIL